MNKKIINILIMLTILFAGITALSAHGVDVTNDKMVIADDANGQHVKDVADNENINISVYKFTSKDEVAHQLEHMLNNSNKHILVVSYQDTAQEFLKSHPEVSDRLIILDQYDDESLKENMKKVADSQTDGAIDFNILIISAMIILVVLMIGAILLLKNKKETKMLSFNRKDIIDRLLALDNDAYLSSDDGQGGFDVYLIGGGALILQNYIPRATHDIDTISIKNTSLLNLMDKYDINANSNAFLDCFAADYSLRAQKLDLQTKIIDYYTLSLEDLVISKIAAGREKDIEDICNKSILNKLDWDLLDSLAETVKESMLSERQINEFDYFYKQYVEENRK